MNEHHGERHLAGDREPEATEIGERAEGASTEDIGQAITEPPPQGSTTERPQGGICDLPESGVVPVAPRVMSPDAPPLGIPDALPPPPSPDGRALSMGDVVGNSEAFVDVYRMVDRVADTTCTVLITGESGTGKELVARAVHRSSSRRDRPFVVVNCGAIPENLLESELFGHAKGSFTGAHVTKSGRIASAEGGTLFLDEIGELPFPLQVKLLRVLQDSDYSPVGDTRTIKANVRIVAATNRNLERAVADGTFREDLFYRLNVIHLHLPPLKERLEDIPELVQFFLKKVCGKRDRQVTGVSRAAAQLLTSWSWPGNVRELENAIERAVVLTSSDVIEPKDLPSRICGLGSERRVNTRLPDAGIDLRRAVESFENDLIRQALERTGWNKNRAAMLLGIKRTTLVEMLKRKRLAPAAA